MELFTELMLLSGFIIELLLGVIVLLKNKHKATYQFFFSLMAGAALWSGLLGLALFCRNPYIDKLCVVAGLFGNAFFFLFAYSFSIKEIVPKKILVTILAIPIILIYPILFTDLIIGDTIFHPNAVMEWLDGPLAIIFYLYHFIYFIGGLLLIFFGYKRASGIRKVQSLYLLFGTGLVISVFFLFNIILPFFKNNYYGVLSSISFIILALFYIYIISRYRFMDIRVMIKKTVIYFLSFSILILLIASLILGANKYLLQNYNSVDIAIVEVILIVVFLPQLKKLTLKAVNRYIKKDEIDLSKNIAEFNRQISYSNYLNDLVTKSTDFLKKELAVGKADFLVRDFTKPELSYFSPLKDKGTLDKKQQDLLTEYFKGEKEILLKQELPFLKTDSKTGKNLQAIGHFLNQENYEALICLKQGEAVNGFILLGKKQNSEIYSQENAKFLKELTSQITSALAKVLYYEEAVARVKREFGGTKI